MTALCLACNAEVEWLGPALLALTKTWLYRCPKCGWTRREKEKV